MKKYYVSTTHGVTWCGLVSNMIDNYSYQNLEYFDTEEEAEAEVINRQS